MTTYTPWDYLIIGAGVSGLAMGWRLAQRGHRVLILEREQAGSGASRAAGGMLAPTAEVKFEEEALLRLGQLSLELYPSFVAELEQAAAMSVDYRSEGTLVVGLDRDDVEALDHIHRYHKELGLAAERLTAEAARKREPGLSPNVQAALYCPADHQLDPRRLVEALAIAFERAGGTLLEHTPVAEIVCEGARVCAALAADGRRFEAGEIVIAAGAWTRTLRGLAPEHMPHVRPVRGQMIAIALGEPALCRHVIRGPDAYLIPHTSGQLIIGATSEEMGFDARLTAGGVFELLRGAWEMLPGIYDSALLDMWTGFRPVSLDGAPILGPSPHIEGLWFAVGHGRNGILLAPITAQLMADALESKQSSGAMAAFLPDRFRRRQKR
ncbi:MAG: glycine oxidase ThiO [Bradymonadaceae bacterium]|nr:glycine oxidase ThiO [Lujinxingiaceae bacterium]